MIRGWCPTVHAPMPSGDGLLVRVKPFGGVLTPAGLLAVADAAARFGNGAIELTSRGNLQLRGVTAAGAPSCAALLVAAGLADADPAREARRNVIVAPPADDALVAEIEAILADTPGLAAKTCVAVGPAAADVVIMDGRLHWGANRAAYSADTLRQILRGLAGKRLPPPLQPGEYRGGGVLLHLPFGQTTADALAALASAAGAVRTTPWRALLAPAGTVAPPGFITDPADPRLHIAACPGGPACASGSVPARADAAWLAGQGIAGVHVSGCAKGCAHPGPAAATLVGRAGRYDLVRHGRAGDTPALTGLTLAQAAGVLAQPAA